MYVKDLRLWNFRKYGSSDDLDRQPDLVVTFNRGLNVLIGENDSGKTAILDAVKLVLKTHAYEWIKAEKDDFTSGCSRLKVEMEFAGITDHEAKNFIEWLGWDDELIGTKVDKRPKLILIYKAELKNGQILPSDVKAGMDGTGHLINAEAREYLKCTYLKALRDADTELLAKKNSRLSQILQEHKLFKKTDRNTQHELEKVIANANQQIKEYFENDEVSPENGKSNRDQIITPVNNFLEQFIDKRHLSKFDIADVEIKSILEKISLGISGYNRLGLGTMNRLFMAAELLHLKKENYDGLRLCLVEELEAHLHPQAQMKIIEVLEVEAKNNIQFILTTHSPNLASKVPIENLIICDKDGVYPLAKNKTTLENKNYTYLKRFLDVTKSNLFFAKGLIIVEGWAEEILLPVIAKKQGYDLTKHEVSIVNVGSTAYLHFAKIFQRSDGKKMRRPISVVTDLDVRPGKSGSFDQNQQENKKATIEKTFGDLTTSNIKINIAKEWTLEWCLFKSGNLSEYFKQAVSKVHNKTKSFKKNKSGWNSNFESTLITKLTKAKGSLDKVAVANELAELIDQKDIDLAKEDEYIKYLIDSIKHACSYAD